MIQKEGSRELVNRYRYKNDRGQIDKQGHKTAIIMRRQTED